MSAGISNATIQEALQRAKQLAAGARSDEPITKRPAQDDFNENPPKRAANGVGGALDMSGNPIATLGGVAPNLATMPGMNDPVLVEQFEVPDHAVGLIIGRGGEQITNIQQTSGCRVQMSPESSGRPTRPCTLQGTRQAIDKAKEMIQSVISRSGGRPPPGVRASGGGMNFNNMGGGGGGGGSQEEMLIPGSKCGLVIGKGGETIKQIQDKAGVKIVLVQDSQTPGHMAKPLRIMGDPDKVAYARQLVDEIMNSKDDNPPHQGGRPDRGGYGGPGGGGGGGYNNYGGGPRSLGEVIVPRSSVGIIIGKGGESIRRLSQESGAKIQFKQDEDQQAPERTAIIQGTPDQIQKATQLISELVNKSNDGGSEVFYMHIPTTKTGLVIGRGGETIKQIAGESGAHVELSREPPPNPAEKVFIIKGSPHQILHAQHIIRIKVGDIPQGTPFDGMPGGGRGPEPGGFNNFQQPGGGGGWGGNFPPQNDPNQVAWAAYYAQQQAAQAQQQYGQQQNYFQQPGGVGPGGQPPQPHQSQPQPQPQPMQQPQIPQQQPQPAVSAAAPSINPQTGQPDYSAQWADYYRSMGMHDQAAAIEQQAKATAANAQVAQPQPGAAAPNAQQMGYPYPQQAAAAPQYNYGGAAPQPQAGAGAPQPGYQFQQPF